MKSWKQDSPSWASGELEATWQASLRHPELEESRAFEQPELERTPRSWDDGRAGRGTPSSTICRQRGRPTPGRANAIVLWGRIGGCRAASPRAPCAPLQRRDARVDAQIDRVRRDEGVLERRVPQCARARLVPLTRRLVVMDVLQMLIARARAVFVALLNTLRRSG